MNQISVDQNKPTKILPFYIDNVFIGTKPVENLNNHEKRFIKDLYLKEVESVYERIGAIIKTLKSANLFDST